MRDLQMYAERAKFMLDQIGIRFGVVDEFTINTRAKSRWGQCKYTSYCGVWELCHYSININADLLDERNPEEALLNTLIHELLHTCKGCWSHTGEWKRLAEKVNREYKGINIQRCSSASEKGVTHVTKKQPRERRYAIGCENCGTTWKYATMCNAVRNPSRYICTKCRCKLIRTA